MDSIVHTVYYDLLVLSCLLRKNKYGTITLYITNPETRTSCDMTLFSDEKDFYSKYYKE